MLLLLQHVSKPKGIVAWRSIRIPVVPVLIVRRSSISRTRFSRLLDVRGSRIRSIHHSNLLSSHFIPLLILNNSNSEPKPTREDCRPSFRIVARPHQDVHQGGILPIAYLREAFHQLPHILCRLIEHEAVVSRKLLRHDDGKAPHREVPPLRCCEGESALLLLNSI